MKIYTRTGDKGETGLLGGVRVSKSSGRVAAYGEVDELNAYLGVSLVHLNDPYVEVLLKKIQADLFIIGSHLATPVSPETEKVRAYLPPLEAGRVTELEQVIDACEDELPPLQSFILPGGNPGAAYLHLARAVCRRAERRVVDLAQRETVAEEILTYINRLSDLLFVLARRANFKASVNDIPWLPTSREAL